MGCKYRDPTRRYYKSRCSCPLLVLLWCMAGLSRWCTDCNLGRADKYPIGQRCRSGFQNMGTLRFPLSYRTVDCRWCIDYKMVLVDRSPTDHRYRSGFQNMGTLRSPLSYTAGFGSQYKHTYLEDYS
jgi:hypothetical protein